jgi:hypothetical protein
MGMQCTAVGRGTLIVSQINRRGTQLNWNSSLFFISRFSTKIKPFSATTIVFFLLKQPQPQWYQQWTSRFTLKGQKPLLLFLFFLFNLLRSYRVLLIAYWCFLEFLFSVSTTGIVFLTNVILDAPWPNEFWRIGIELGLKNFWVETQNPQFWKP